MDEAAIALRNLTYRMFVRGGRASTALEVAAEAQFTVAEVTAAWRRLAEAHAVVLEGESPA